MFVLNMAVGSEMASWGMQSFWNFAKTSIKNKLGQKVFGAVATSPFGDYEAEYRAVLNNEQVEETTPKKVLMFARNYLTAWGYLAIIPGALIKWLRNKVFPSATIDQTGRVHQAEGSIFGTVLSAIGNLLLFGGPIAAFVGQIMPFQRQFALGEKKQAEMQRALMDKGSDRKIFEELNVQTKIHEPAQYLEDVLTYKREVYAAIFNRSDHDDVETAFIHGPTGSGKTTGARVILSRWGKKVADDKHNCIPRVIKIDLALLEQSADKMRERALEKADIAGSFGDTGKDIAELIKQDVGDPLLVFELLISDMEDHIRALNEYNEKVRASRDPNQKEQRLSFFIDEYDKIGAMARKSTDINRLVRILGRLNNLIDPRENPCPVIITSNKSPEQIAKDLKAIIPEDLHASIVDPHIRRIGDIEVFVDDPEPKEQAEILAKYLLDSFDPNVLDITYGREKLSFTSHSRVKNIEILRAPILDEISSRPTSCLLNGSHLATVVKSCKQVLSSLADDVRDKVEPDTESKRLGFSNEEWSKLSGAEKIKITGVKLKLSKLKEFCESEQAKRVSVISVNDNPRFASRLKNGIAEGIVKAFISKKREILERGLENLFKGKMSNEKVLAFLSTAYKVDGDVLASYEPVAVKVGDTEKMYKHAISLDRSRKVVQIGYVPASNHEIDSRKGFHALGGIEMSSEIPLEKFATDCLKEVAKVFGVEEKKGRKFVDIIREAVDTLRGGEEFDLSALEGVASLLDAFGLKGAPA